MGLDITLHHLTVDPSRLPFELYAKPMTSKLTFLGCGDAFSSGGRFTTCFLVDTGKLRFLIDFGVTAMAATKRADVAMDEIPLIFITHLHGDHVGGLPLLLLEAALVHKRTVPLTIAGPPGLRAHLPRLTDALFPGTSLELPFELNVLELPPDLRTDVMECRRNATPRQARADDCLYRTTV